MNLKLITTVNKEDVEKFAKALFKENQELRKKLIDLEEKVEHLEKLLVALPVEEIKRG